jgi:hypothetical protein
VIHPGRRRIATLPLLALVVAIVVVPRGHLTSHNVGLNPVLLMLWVLLMPLLLLRERDARDERRSDEC